MSTVIYEFSGTGNSLHTARQLALELGGEVKAIPAELEKGVPACSADVVGIVFPVYCWAAPGIVEEFTDRIRFTGAPYVFAVATYAGSCGYGYGQLEQVLARSGTKLSAAFGIKMPTNYLPLRGLKSAEDCTGLLARADAEIAKIAQRVRMREVMRIPRGWFFPNAMLPLVRKHVVFSTGKWDKGFSADSKCNGCGLCARVCPADNIKITDGKPVWQHRCLSCLACIHYCPQQAIQMSGSSSQPRYHHPRISAADMEAQKNTKT